MCCVCVCVPLPPWQQKIRFDQLKADRRSKKQTYYIISSTIHTNQDVKRKTRIKSRPVRRHTRVLAPSFNWNNDAPSRRPGLSGLFHTGWFVDEKLAIFGANLSGGQMCLCLVWQWISKCNSRSIAPLWPPALQVNTVLSVCSRHNISADVNSKPLQQRKRSDLYEIKIKPGWA